ncbi:MAG: MFS transporter [Acidobacteriota bacterium]
MSLQDSLGVNRAVIALSVARLADAMGNSILFIVLPLYVAKMPAPWFPFPEPVRVGILISLFGLVSATFQPIMGALSDRIGRRKAVIQAGLLLMGAATFSFLFAARFADLLVLRTVQGIGVALTIPASMAIMAAVTSKKTRGGAMGVYTTLRMVGFASGPLVGGLLQVKYGFNAAFVVGTALILLGMVLVQLWVQDVRVERPATDPRPFRMFEPSIMSSGIMGVGVATFVMASAFSMMTTLERQFNARLNETALGFSVAFSALMVSRLLFQVPLARLSDRVGRKPPIIAGLVLMAPATALLGEVVTTGQLTGLRLLQGLGAAAIAAPAFALAGDLAKAGGEGRQMSIVTMGFGLGIALGPLLAGLLAVHSFELPFFVGGVMALGGAWVVARYVPETVRRTEKAARL